MLEAYAQKGNLEDAENLLCTIPDTDEVTWSIMLMAYSDHGKLNEALTVFDRTPHYDVVLLTTLVSAYARHGHVRESEILFDSMPGWTLISWNAMLAAYLHNREFDLVDWTFSSMPVRDAASWSALVAAVAARGQFERAECLLETMPERGIAAWNTVLAMNSINRRGSQAADIFARMKLEENYGMNEVTLNCVLLGCTHAGDLASGRRYFRSAALDHEIPATKQHYCCLIDLLSRAGYLIDAEELLTTMPFVPEAQDWLCLLGACRSHREIGVGSRAAQEVLGFSMAMLKAGPYILLSNMYALGERLGLPSKLFLLPSSQEYRSRALNI
ncbi:pentatricopeptide repeat-containing protein At4g02750-like [Selaginella moellendorffii]|uniref:pentatricopeptide repeat-containing protein At4g02750-like n=1 Tax=Selaginella moellendorffii TaxID=88036 RepID=UPI000D1C65CE|nr:pentatricopeptide repeat-containing protein At4g02750-like [Selaginella moellendorffii]|eukprot:XP_024515040.1 pentatricopeptide repeat-containing protein At4g02750-like [Selaginella moellendorffii]